MTVLLIIAAVIAVYLLIAVILGRGLRRMRLSYPDPDAALSPAAHARLVRRPAPRRAAAGAAARRPARNLSPA